jgi:hypothetical protein
MGNREWKIKNAFPPPALAERTPSRSPGISRAGQVVECRGARIAVVAAAQIRDR